MINFSKEIQYELNEMLDELEIVNAKTEKIYNKLRPTRAKIVSEIEAIDDKEDEVIGKTIYQTYKFMSRYIDQIRKKYIQDIPFVNIAYILFDIDPAEYVVSNDFKVSPPDRATMYNNINKEAIFQFEVDIIHKVTNKQLVTFVGRINVNKLTISFPVVISRDNDLLRFSDGFSCYISSNISAFIAEKLLLERSQNLNDLLLLYMINNGKVYTYDRLSQIFSEYEFSIEHTLPKLYRYLNRSRDTILRNYKKKTDTIRNILDNGLSAKKYSRKRHSKLTARRIKIDNQVNRDFSVLSHKIFVKVIDFIEENPSINRLNSALLGENNKKKLWPIFEDVKGIDVVRWKDDSLPKDHFVDIYFDVAYYVFYGNKVNHFGGFSNRRRTPTFRVTYLFNVTSRKLSIASVSKSSLGIKKDDFSGKINDIFLSDYSITSDVINKASEIEDLEDLRSELEKLIK